jgi:hypothetical protein
MTLATRHATRRSYGLAIIALGATAIACAESTSPDITVVSFDALVQPVLTATSSVTGAAGSEVIRVAVVVTNPDAFARRYSLHQPCLLSLRLYVTPDRTGTPVYPNGTGPGGCKASVLYDTLAAHASVTYAGDSYPLVYSPSTPNGQRLPPGRYYGTVSMDILELTPAVRTLPVGEVVLAAP